jgi:hypothetical protein
MSGYVTDLAIVYGMTGQTQEFHQSGIDTEQTLDCVFVHN